MSTRLTVLLTGGSGRLGSALQALAPDTVELIAPSRDEFDVTQFEAWQAWLGKTKPDVVLHAAAITDTREETPVSTMWRTNALAPLMMAHACQAAQCPWWHISTDYVFDGESASPYEPVLPATPARGNYGQSKAWAEVALMKVLESQVSAQGIIGRIGWLMHGQGDFVDAILKQGMAQQPLTVVSNQWGTPTFVRPLAQWMIEVLLRTQAHHAQTGQWAWCGYEPYHPLWHLVMAGGSTSRYAWAERLLQEAGFHCPITPTPLPAFPPRPQNCVLVPYTPGHPSLPSWQEAEVDVVQDWLASH